MRNEPCPRCACVRRCLGGFDNHVNGVRVTRRIHYAHTLRLCVIRGKFAASICNELSAIGITINRAESGPIIRIPSIKNWKFRTM